MNLLERLSPDHLERLKAEEVKYPVTMRILMRELSDNVSWADLKYGTICNLIFNLGVKQYDYSPEAIKKIFDYVDSMSGLIEYNLKDILRGNTTVEKDYEED